MSSTYLALYYHLIFSTANREPYIGLEWRSRLHEYLGGTVNKLGGQSLGIGGTHDHVHALVELNAIHCLADFMREVKKASSTWGTQQNGSVGLYVAKRICRADGERIDRSESAKLCRATGRSSSENRFSRGSSGVAPPFWC